MQKTIFAVLGSAAKKIPKAAFIVSGILTAFLLLAYVERREASLLYKSAPRTVIIASVDIAQGEPLGLAVVTSRQIPTAFVEPEAISDAMALQGKVAAVKIPRGAQIFASQLIDSSELTAASSLVPAGMDLAMIGRSDGAVWPSFLKRGDRVRVVAAFDGHEKNGGKRSAIVVDKALVLFAPEQQSRLEKKSGAFSAVTPRDQSLGAVAIAITKQDALKLRLAEKFGTVSLVACGRDGCAKSSGDEVASLEDLLRGKANPSLDGLYRIDENEVAK